MTLIVIQAQKEIRRAYDKLIIKGAKEEKLLVPATAVAL